VRGLGAHTAFVTATHDNEAAGSLYKSVSFKTVNTERLYGKKIWITSPVSALTPHVTVVTLL
jgi:hypothetical protein